MDSERELIARCLRGDTAAWDLLFDLHYAATGRFIYQLAAGLTAEDVEEITQETFISVIRNLGSFGGSSRLSTWIFRIATNKAHDYRARSHAQKRGGGQPMLSLNGDGPVGLGLDPASPGPGPDAVLLQEERWSVLRSSIDALGVTCRELIELRYFGELSYEEIGEALQLNTKTVSSRLSRCLGRLEQIYQASLAEPDRERTRRSAV